MAGDELDEVIAESMQDPLFALHFRIRGLHAPAQMPSGYCADGKGQYMKPIYQCAHCSKDWPCPTIKTLES